MSFRDGVALSLRVRSEGFLIIAIGHGELLSNISWMESDFRGRIHPEISHGHGVSVVALIYSSGSNHVSLLYWQGNCSPRFMRSTTAQLPITADAMGACKVKHCTRRVVITHFRYMMITVPQVSWRIAIEYNCVIWRLTILSCRPHHISPVRHIRSFLFVLRIQIPMAVIVQPMALVGPEEQAVPLVDFGELFSL